MDFRQKEILTSNPPPHRDTLSFGGVFFYTKQVLTSFTRRSLKIYPCFSWVFFYYLLVWFELFDIILVYKNNMNEVNWYVEIIRPNWAPPAWLFGPVWSLLYTIIAISFGRVFVLLYRKIIPFKVALPFILNLIFNFSFSPIQFQLQNYLLASLVIILVLITIVWSMISIYKYERWITYVQIPYLLWVLFATVLQITITYLNF